MGQARENAPHRRSRHLRNAISVLIRPERHLRILTPPHQIAATGALTPRREGAQTPKAADRATT
jgi:hypothetical protein